VVEPDKADRAFFVSVLAAEGFAMMTVANYSDGKSLLTSAPPALLITEIRLGAHNGLHLAHRARLTKPDMTIVLLSAYADPVLIRDVEQVGATFVLKPVTARELAAAINRTALRQPNSLGTFEPIRPPFERRQTDRRQTPQDRLVEMERRSFVRRRAVDQAHRVSFR
jgi:DNA-binding response OmpR family regulator